MLERLAKASLAFSGEATRKDETTPHDVGGCGRNALVPPKKSEKIVETLRMVENNRLVDVDEWFSWEAAGNSHNEL